ncbi:hypothetical protein RICGR_0215 [Rickettsiella grylli]|uniref:Uncharacterized protein n=2 Tax=Rickettsiella grylli TaxID=59196 RepID=A8PKN2_9COXI|nr:hypothetical protein RICGR_0215 [Rickettsiella grylli]
MLLQPKLLFMISAEALNLINQFDLENFKLAKRIKASLNLSLRQYLKNLIPSPNKKNNRYFSYLQKAIAIYLHQHAQTNIDNQCALLEKTPVIQQADHASLLLDSETFLNNFMYAIACQENDIDKMFTSQCTTVSCLSKRNPIQGPTFLRTMSSLFSILPFSKRTLKNSNFCCLPKPTKVQIKLISGEQLFAKSSLLNSINDRNYPSPSFGYHQSNKILWDLLKIPGKVERIAFDESMVSRLTEIHLRDTYSPVYTLLFDPNVRDAFIDVKRSFVNSNENKVINKSTPDFFWYRKNTRLYPLKLVGFGNNAKYHIEDIDIPLPFVFSVESLTNALRNEDIFADKFLAYLMRCLLPGVVAVGGTSQQDYVDHYQKIIALTNTRAPFLSSADLAVIIDDKLSQLGGSPLLEMNIEQKNLIAYLNEKTDLDAFATQFLDLPLSETIGTLHCSRYIIDCKPKEIRKNEYFRNK